MLYSTWKAEHAEDEKHGQHFADISKCIFWLIFLKIIFIDISLKYITEGLIDDKSTLVQVMTWCHQAATCYLNQCWSKSMMQYGAIIVA